MGVREGLYDGWGGSGDRAGPGAPSCVSSWGALLLPRLHALHPSAPLLAHARSVWGSGCSELKAQLPALSQALYTPTAKLRLLIRRIAPNRKRLHHFPKGRAECPEPPGPRLPACSPLLPKGPLGSLSRSRARCQPLLPKTDDICPPKTRAERLFLFQSPHLSRASPTRSSTPQTCGSLFSAGQVSCGALGQCVSWSVLRRDPGGHVLAGASWTVSAVLWRRLWGGRESRGLRRLQKLPLHSGSPP